MSKSFNKSESATRAARLAAVQALYEIEISGAAADDVLLDFLNKRWTGLPETEGTGPADQTKFKKLLRGVTGNLSQLDEMLDGALDPQHKSERLDVLLKCLLRTAVFELFHQPNVPARVLINEYLNMSHAFFSENEPGLVNGILDKLAGVLRPEEMEKRGNG